MNIPEYCMQFYNLYASSTHTKFIHEPVIGCARLGVSGGVLKETLGVFLFMVSMLLLRLSKFRDV